METPGRDVQADRFHPVFERLRQALENDGVGELRADPTSLAPERVVVFEIAGTVGNFPERSQKYPVWNSCWSTILSGLPMNSWYPKAINLVSQSFRRYSKNRFRTLSRK